MSRTSLTLIVAIAVALGLAPHAPGQCETAQLYASDADPADEFGHAVAVAGDVVVVGAPRHAPGAAGAAYVSRRQPGGAWVEEQLLAPAGLAPGSEFGTSVAVDGDVCVVGAPRDPTAAFDAGAAYVYRWDGAAWQLEATLFSFDRDPLDEFGHAVAIDGDVIVVGAWHDPDEGTKSGSAHVYRWDGAAWQHEAKLIGSDVTIEDKFGESCDVSGDVLAIGARGDDESATTGGAVYVYRRVGGAWIEETKLVHADAVNFDRLGQAVAVDGDVVVAGAYFDDDAGVNSGAAFVFVRDPQSGTWSELQKLSPVDLEIGDQLGFSVDLDGDLAAVAARRDDDSADNAGAVYLFRDVGGTWIEEAKLVAKDGADDDRFGQAVALDAGRLIVGAPADDDQGFDAGAAYLFEDVDLFTLIAPLGNGLAGVGGVPALTGLGALSPGAPLDLALHDAAPASVSWLALGTRELRAPLKGGVLVPAPDVVLGPLATDADGAWALSASLPALPGGVTVTLQAWTSDAAAPAGLSASTALRLSPPAGR